MKCTGLFYPDKPSARDDKRRVMRAYHMATNIIHCEACDGYHLIGDIPKLLLPKKAIEILKMMAQGYSYPEISKYMSMKVNTVSWYANVLRLRFNAMDSKNLIAIACAFKIINPHEFVPALKPIPEENPNGRVDPGSYS